MVLLFSQRVAFNMLSQGHSRIGNLADNTTRFIEDHVAEFIVSNGGWVSCILLFSNAHLIFYEPSFAASFMQ